ncbi:MAG: NAD(P)H-binding protein [Bacteroidales bacterium]|nr:NAD(P)H-binding protein [Bacteroidales bacterium]
MNKTAIVFGATGLVGSELIYHLIQDIRYRAIKVFTRRELHIEHIKVIENIVSVDNPDEYKDLIKGDDLFICLGTTRRKAGSVKRMEEIDRDLPYIIAQTALLNGVKNIAVVSSIGANAASGNYYYRIKGEMEDKINSLDFKRRLIVRPSILLGKRQETRILESAAKGLITAFSFALKGKNRRFRGIKARDVAYAMVREINNVNGKELYESDELLDLAYSNNND